MDGNCSTVPMDEKVPLLAQKWVGYVIHIGADRVSPPGSCSRTDVVRLMLKFSKNELGFHSELICATLCNENWWWRITSDFGRLLGIGAQHTQISIHNYTMIFTSLLQLELWKLFLFSHCILSGERGVVWRHRMNWDHVSSDSIVWVCVIRWIAGLELLERWLSKRETNP